MSNIYLWGAFQRNVDTDLPWLGQSICKFSSVVSKVPGFYSWEGKSWVSRAKIHVQNSQASNTRPAVRCKQLLVYRASCSANEFHFDYYILYQQVWLKSWSVLREARSAEATKAQWKRCQTPKHLEVLPWSAHVYTVTRLMWGTQPNDRLVSPAKQGDRKHL